MVLEVFAEENLLRRAEVLGNTLRQRFDSLRKRYEIIGDVRGKGPMLALELVRDRETKQPAATEAKALVKFCAERGLIILSCGNFGNMIRTLMPLVITDEQLSAVPLGLQFQPLAGDYHERFLPTHAHR
jgi:4-aminobutyrate aminotransferase / (S)-3-amino-2-methylpropionate transaminase / 5-aminovalerate transaminase